MTTPDSVPKAKRSTGPSAQTKRAAVKPPASARSLGQGLSAPASQRAALILEVLAGERTPQQAAAALSVSLPYFYLLERKALQGLLQACEPQPKGPPAPSAERKLAALEAELARCRRECQRQAALVRATQRAIGLPALPPSDATKSGKSGSDKTGARRRRRRPTTRALRAAQTVRANSARPETHGQVEPLVETPAAAASATCAKETDHVAASG
jgi:hypothetical protein